nr:class I SAM-dependent methyltransferase [Pedobacter sp. ASV2]
MDIYNESYDFFCNLISSDFGNVLDVGCGPENITCYLLNKKPEFNILGTDISVNMVELVKANNPTTHFKLYNCRNIRTWETKFNGIICGFCLTYLSTDECKDLIKSCYDHLVKDGAVYFSFVEGNPADSGFQTGSSRRRIYFNYHTLEQIEGCLSTVGFKNLKVIKIAYVNSPSKVEHHTVVIADTKDAES